MGAVKDQMICMQESAERTLAVHQVASRGMLAWTPDVCACGEEVVPEEQDDRREEVTSGRDRAFARHQAAVLADVWFG